MIIANDILTLIGIPGEKIQSCSCDLKGDESVIYVELSDIRPYCPHCKSDQVVIKDYYNVTINNSIIKHQKINVFIRVRRYKCKKCGKTFKQDIGISDRKRSISYAVQQAVMDDLKEPLTFKAIADDHHISPITVRRIFEKGVLEQYRLPLSEIICIDEFCFKHKHSDEGKYPAVITNPMNGKIIDIIRSRWKPVLVDYFNHIQVDQKKSVKYFVSDMNETYREIRKTFFKDAIHIADRFHVIKAFNDAITSIRTRIIKQEVWQKSEYIYLKKNWKVFLKDREDLKKYKKTDKWGHVTDPTVELDYCLSKYPDLYYAYWTKEEFRKASKQLLYYGKAEELVNFNINKLLNNSIPEMAKVGKTLQNWKYEIINGMTQNPYSMKISNAIAEATNNQIQTLIDLCYGLPIFECMRKRVLYINRSKKN